MWRGGFVEMGERRNSVRIHSNKKFLLSSVNSPKHLIIPLKSGIFAKFFEGYLLPLKDLDVTDSIYLEKVFFNNPAITIYTVKQKNLEEEVGYFFIVSLSVRCEGGYLLSYIKQNAGKVQKGTRLLKTEYLTLYNFPNGGVMAISPKIAPWLEHVFETQ